jgi:hypothetical protein
VYRLPLAWVERAKLQGWGAAGKEAAARS